jgi:1,4-alpha-glucan branching enzyme
MYKGYLCLMLHAHLPYVRHPEYKDFLEEDWFYEAMTETYIPLLQVFEDLVRDGIDFRITMSLTPTLLSMMTDPLLQERYLLHLNKLIDLAESEVERTRWLPEFHPLAQMYFFRLHKARDIFENRNGRNLVPAFRRLQERGVLEITTCGATHGFLPLMELSPQAVRAQIRTACEHYEGHFGRRPKGIWLPECGFTPGVDEILREEGIRYLFTESHGILHASPRPKYGVFAPIITPSGVAAFGRDMESSKQVWSAEEGYPGDYEYREFYRDVGFDLEYDYIRPYLHEDGIRINTGIKYYRITGPGTHKLPYDPHRAMEKAAQHAGNFMFNREKQIEFLYDKMGRMPILVAPYDAELFGHWWYEGPDWINMLLRKVVHDQKTVRLITPPEYLNENPTLQVSMPSMSSWGYKGFAEVWLEGSNDWIYRHLHKATERMTELADRFGGTNGLHRRALNQAARELLLAQSSDWAFIMKTGTMVDYAVKRTKDHLLRFQRLSRELQEDRIDEGYLSVLEDRDNIFPDINFEAYRSV